jgi:glycosyltransferase involved in cell wall biosynthesis
VVYPGIDHSKFRLGLDERLKHKVRDKYALPAKFVLAMSTVEPRKNFENMVQAFEKIKHPETYLLIVGRLGWLYKGLLKRIEASPKKSRIRMVGYVDEQDKPYLISQAKAVCYPSYYEGFGFVPLEAMACGVPVITSARTAMPEVCDGAALLVEPYQQNDLVDALDQILSDERLREYYITKGLERVKQFSWKKCGDEIKEHLNRLV